MSAETSSFRICALSIDRIHDFIDPKLSRAVPYGVYDITNNVGWVSVGTDHDTASFAVNAIRRWWRAMGKKRHPKANRLMISADGGGSNGYRVRLWKIELQRLADDWHRAGKSIRSGLSGGGGSRH